MSYPLPQNRFQYEKHHIGNADGINAGDSLTNRQCAQDADPPGGLVVRPDAQRRRQSDGLEAAPGPAESPGLFSLGQKRPKLVNGRVF